MVLLAVTLLPLVVAYAWNLPTTTTIVILPSDGSYQVGNIIEVEVWVENAVDLFGADVRLAFDATRLQVVDAAPTLPGVQIQPRSDILAPDFVLRREADNTAGTIWYAATQINPSPPASGSGALFSFSFEVIGAGVTEVPVTMVQLADQNGESIAVEASGANYDLVTDMPPPTATPTATSTVTLTPMNTATSTPTSTATATVTPTATPTTQPSSVATLRVLPVAGSYTTGETFAVEIWVEDVVDLYAVDIRLAFDPDLLQVQDENLALPGIQIDPRSDLLYPDFIVHQEADNVAGTIWYAVTQTNPRVPASGSGALFAFHFNVVAEGTAVIILTESTLATRDGETIPHETFGAVYEIAADVDESFKLFLPVLQQGS
ncbi:MAG: hypothetical protein H6659_05610 [Ardenticatenaceae bacterium]|nr:hypothetical protein [Ardenticatenaceae bacterium]